MRKFFDGYVRISSEEDSGMALIAENFEGNSEQLFIKLQSWSEEKYHPEMRKLEGKYVRITLETED